MCDEEDYNHDPDGIWFDGGGLNCMTYQIQGDTPTRSAAFTDCDVYQAFEAWKGLVDLTKEMDRSANFFRQDGTDTVLCVILNDYINADVLGVDESIVEAVENCQVPDGWSKVAAKDIVDLIKFKYAGDTW